MYYYQKKIETKVTIVLKKFIEKHATIKKIYALVILKKAYLQNFPNFRSQGDEFSEVLVVEVVQSTSIFRIWNEPVDRGEMLTLRQFLVQTPEHLYNTCSTQKKC